MPKSIILNELFVKMESQFILITVSSEVLLDDKFSDMTISINESEFNVHKAVMSSISPYFRCLLSRDWLNKEQQLVGIPGVSADTLSLIVKYAYSGSVQITEKIAQDLFVVANFLLITDLIEKCCQFLETSLCPENCICIYMFACDFKTSSTLYQNSKRYVLQHFEEVVKASSNFLELSLEQLEEIIDGDELNMKNEHLVFETILRWIDHAPEARNKHMVVLLPKVRLGLMDPIYLSENVRNNALVSSHKTCTESISSVMKSTVDVSHLSRPRLPSSIIFAIGGWKSGKSLDLIEVYDIKVNHWVKISHHAERPRSVHGTVILDQCLYCIGGYDGSEYSNNVMKFDLRTQIWQEVSPMNDRRGFISVVVLDGLIYAIGGYDGHAQLNTAECYDPHTDQWTPLRPMSEKRSDASATSLDGLLYLCGGYSGTKSLSTLECYDPKASRWHSIKPMGSLRSGPGVIACGNRIYAVGGWDGTNHLKTVEAYDPYTNQWETIEPMKNRRSNFGIAVVDDLLFAVGSWTETGDTSNVEFYDCKKKEWCDAGKLNVGRIGLSCCVASDLPNTTQYTASRDPLH